MKRLRDLELWTFCKSPLEAGLVKSAWKWCQCAMGTEPMSCESIFVFDRGNIMASATWSQHVPCWVHPQGDTLLRRRSKIGWSKSIRSWTKHVVDVWMGRSQLDIWHNRPASNKKHSMSCYPYIANAILESMTFIDILLMEEILHHLGCIKPWKEWEKLATSTGAVFSSIACYECSPQIQGFKMNGGHLHQFEDEDPSIVCKRGQMPPYEASFCKGQNFTYTAYTYRNLLKGWRYL